MKNILLDCFHEQVIITITNEVRRRGCGNRVVAGFLSGEQKPQGFEEYRWLKHNDADNFQHPIFREVDVIISLNNPVAIKEVAKLAVHHNRPLICCAHSLNEQSFHPLANAAYYVPTLYYGCYDDNLDLVITNLLRIADSLPQMPITGKVYRECDI